MPRRRSARTDRRASGSWCRRRAGSRQDEPGDPLGRVEPVVRVEDATPTHRAGAAPVRAGLHVQHIAEPHRIGAPGNRSTSFERAGFVIFMMPAGMLPMWFLPIRVSISDLRRLTPAAVG